MAKHAISLRKRLLRYLMLVLWGLLVGLIIVEIFFRFFVPSGSLSAGFSPESPYQYDSEVGWRYKRDWQGRNSTGEFDVSVQINEQGFRSSTPYTETGSIALMGDSYVSANQIEEARRFSDLLAGHLAESSPDWLASAPVYNFGVDGMGMTHYLAQYRYHIRPFEPRMVIINISTVNDFTDSSPEFMYQRGLRPNYIRDEDGNITDIGEFPTPPGSLAQSIGKFFYRNVATYRFISIARRKLRETDSSGIPKVFLMYEDPWQPPYQRAWDYSEWALRELIAEIQADGAVPVIMLMPPMPVIDDENWGRITEAYESHYSGRIYRERVGDQVGRVAAETGTHYLDLSDHLKAAFDSGDNPFLETDGHLSEAGHELVAAILYDELMMMDAPQDE